MSFSRSAGQTDRKTLIRTLPLYMDRWLSVVGGKLEKSFDLRLINKLHYSFTCLVLRPWHLTHNVITWKTKMFWICENFFNTAHVNLTPSVSRVWFVYVCHQPASLKRFCPLWRLVRIYHVYLFKFVKLLKKKVF